MTAEPAASHAAGRVHGGTPPAAGSVRLDALTPSQAAFAKQIGATSLIEPSEAEGPVLLYRDGEFITQRWLVDRNGQVLDTVSFHRSTRP